MTDIERHIEVLLLSNDCVIIPGFGGFMTHQVGAYYDEEDGLMFPPRRTIGFNPQLKLNDSLIAQSYVEAYDISFPEAMRRIDGDVETLRTTLEKEHVYEFNDIGTLSLDNAGHYDFKPCEAGLLTPSLYALSSYEIESLAAKAAKKEPVRQSQLLGESALAQPSSLHIGRETTAHKDAITLSIPLAYVRNIAAIALLAVVLVLMPKQHPGNSIGAGATSSIDTGMLTSVMPKEVTTGKPTTIKQATPTKAKTPSETKPTAKTSEAKVKTYKPKTEAVGKPTAQPSQDKPTESKPYTVVLAARVSMANAQAFVERLKKQGLKEAEVLQGGKLAKVIYGHYASQDEANAAKRQLSSNAELSDAWVTNIAER